MTWNVHICDAAGSLTPYTAALHLAVRRVEAAVDAVVDPLQMDVVVQVLPGRTIPEVGFSGFAPGPELIHLYIDPDNPALPSAIQGVERTLAHEAHHCLRQRGPGYGKTLGEALVTEGLAGQFVRELYATPPELWEEPQDSDYDYLALVLENWHKGYDHTAWFFGTGSLPRWLGYRLGYRIVGAYVGLRGTQPSAMAWTDAEEFRGAVTAVRERLPQALAG